MQFPYSLALVTAVASTLLAFPLAHAADLRPMTYDGLKKIIGQTQGAVAKTAPQLVGKTLTVKLKSSNDALFVDAKDGVYFTCDKRAAAFKSGSVTTTVTKYGLTPDGDVSVALENCG